MRWLRNMPINRKLTVIILAACTIVLFVAGAAMIVAEFMTSRRTMAENIAVTADLLGRNSVAALAFHREEDQEELTKHLSALEADPYIWSARIYDEHGQPFADYVRSGVESALSPTPPPDGARFSRSKLEIAHPIFMDKNRKGTIYLQAHLGRIYSQLAMHVGILGIVFVAAILLTSVMSSKLRRPIAQPILDLAHTARHVAEKKDYSVRAPKRGSDEIGLLTDAFNQMLGEIQVTHDALAVAKDAAEAANQAKDQFLAVLSHELRTPLTPVLLTVSMLQNLKELPPGVREDLQTIRHHVELEARLIDDLLDITRIARSKLRLNVETVDVHSLVHDALKICCNENKHNVELNLVADDHYVRADSARLLQVIWNLLSNALKFTTVGGSICISSWNPTNSRIQIQIADTGIGIDPAMQPHIFSAFVQVDSSLTRNFGGLGLGLAIAKALIEAQGGTISVFSEGVGKGATFTIEMDIAPSPQARPSRRPPSGSEIHRKLRILLVEDHEATLTSISRLLQNLGHQVTTASSVKEALAIAEHEELDLLISDVGLPDGSGHEVMDSLKTSHPIRGIALSGFGMDDDIRRSMDAGFAHHLTKPVDLDRLQKAIRQTV